MAVIDFSNPEQGGYWGSGPDVIDEDYLRRLAEQQGSTAHAPVPVYTPPPSGAFGGLTPTGKASDSGGNLYTTPGYVAPPPSSNANMGIPNVPRPSVDASVVYTDPSGNAYDPGALAKAWSDPAFRNDPLNARVGDILQQHSTSAAPPAPPPTSTKTPYDGSQSLLLNAALQRLSQLQQPIDRTAEDAYTKMALDRVAKLGGAPFTDTQNAALLTQHMEPLTQARDQAKRQAAEDLSRRGFTPTSGVFQDRMKAIDTAYERGVAGVTNSLNIQGIDATQKNAALQLQILDSLVSMGRVSRQEADQRSAEILQTAGVPFETDLKTLNSLTTASNSGPSADSIINSLMQLGGLNQRGNVIQTQQNAQDAAAMGQVVGYILSHHADFGF